jgi:hypothetical protein
MENLANQGRADHITKPAASIADRAFQRAAASANSPAIQDGRVAEWFKAPVLKTGRG